MNFNHVLVAAALVGAVGLSGCSSASKALGMSKVTPDEFRVVTKPPLVVPPDFSLRPPAPGEPRPQELLPESAARQALAGERAGQTRTQGERAFVARAGAEQADPLVRYVVDDEFGDIAHKDKGFADKVMFWRKDRPAAPSEAEVAAAEAERLKSLTANGAIVIQREGGGGRIKLPGL